MKSAVIWYVRRYPRSFPDAIILFFNIVIGINSNFTGKRWTVLQNYQWRYLGKIEKREPVEKMK
jgi:hypothetical protein